MNWRVLKHFLPEIPGFTHASNPTYHGGNVYFSARDNNRSHIFGATFNPKDLTMGKPGLLLEPGPLGSFDDSGCSVCQVTDEKIIYLGWNLGVTVPFYNTLLSFEDSTRKVLMQRTTEYLSISYGLLINDQLWFGAVTEWPMKCVLIGYPGLDFNDIVSRFSIIGKEMWFCHRKREGQYQLAYALLKNNQWAAEELEIERTGFDKESQCYPWVFDSRGSRYMLYNGDGYGKTGFSIAILEE